jgi:hypothetical protein
VSRASANIAKAQLAASSLPTMVEHHYTVNVPWMPPSNRGTCEDPHEVWLQISVALLHWIAPLAATMRMWTNAVHTDAADVDDDDLDSDNHDEIDGPDDERGHGDVIFEDESSDVEDGRGDVSGSDFVICSSEDSEDELSQYSRHLEEQGKLTASDGPEREGVAAWTDLRARQELETTKLVAAREL